MANPSPIPTPKSEQWRAIRLRFLPLLVFGATAASITFLWRDTIMPPTFTGEVEHIESRVASAEAGTLTQLNVNRFQVVAKGTPLAVVEAIDTRVMDYEVRLQRLRLPWLQEKVTLATAQSNLQFAQIELNRAETLLKKKVMSPFEYDAFLKKKQALELQVDEQKRLITDLERQIEKFQSANPPGENGSSSEPVLADKEFKNPVPEISIGRKVLTAPIDGMVSLIYHHAGESITAGDPILVIAAPQSTHVIGYMRDPISLQPEVGMEVRIRGRDAQRTMAFGRITRIGVAFEPVAVALQNPLLNRNGLETGLPVEVSVPTGFQLRPGGIVDLTLIPKPRKTVASQRL